MRRSIRIRLMIFTVIGAFALCYAGAKYARLTDVVLSTSYTVRADLPVSGGVFPGAEVTYRGVPVGTVSDVDLTDTGVLVDLQIRNDIQVPDDVTANVHNRSAVGEQYVDLVPRRAGGPWLRDGDVIEHEDTSLPVQEEDLLASLDAFVGSVDTDDLQTVVTELGRGFRDAGPVLQALLDGSTEFISHASASLPQTIALLEHTTTVLEGQRAGASDIGSFARDLASLTGTIRKQDKALSTVLTDGAPLARQLGGLVNGLSLNVPPLLANLAAVGQLTILNLDALEQGLVAFPWSLGGTHVGVKDRSATFIAAVTQDPKVCQVGYLRRDQWRATNDLSVSLPDYSLQCREDGKVQRGSRYAP